MMHKLRKICFILILSSFLCTIHSCRPADSLAPLRNQLSSYIAPIDARIGIAVLTCNGDSLTLNNQLHYPMMSVFKFHQSIAVANYLADNHGSLMSLIPINYDGFSPNTYSPLRDQYPQGNIMKTIKELLQYSLQLSDNIATDILFNTYYSPLQVDSLLKSKSGITDFNITYNETHMHHNHGLCYDNWTTPFATTQLLHQFLQGHLTTNPYTNFIKQTMLNCQTGQSRLAAPILNTPACIGHKTGTGYLSNGRLSAINDVGFIYLPTGDYYTIAVYIKEAALSIPEAERVIAHISQLVYEYLK